MKIEFPISCSITSIDIAQNTVSISITLGLSHSDHSLLREAPRGALSFRVENLSSMKICEVLEKAEEEVIHYWAELTS